MLAAAHEALRQGRDLIVGYVEPHARPDTMALLEGLPSLDSTGDHLSNRQTQGVRSGCRIESTP